VQVGGTGLQVDTMNEDPRQREQERERLSALADGELQGGEFAQAVGFAGGDDGRAAWALYHLVGDVLRSPELACHGRPDLLAAVCEQIAKEPLPALQPVPVVQVAQPEVPAANGSVFRWKMVAGFASLAAVSAIGWNAATNLRATDTSGAPGAQIAAAPAAQAPSPIVATAVEGLPGQPGPQIMLRDPRLDELLAAHQQFGSTSALQMPAGFLRNATFEAPPR
jgi:sigma-E factor negative regulatory protein RseA